MQLCIGYQLLWNLNRQNWTAVQFTSARNRLASIPITSMVHHKDSQESGRSSDTKIWRSLVGDHKCGYSFGVVISGNVVCDLRRSQAFHWKGFLCHWQTYTCIWSCQQCAWVLKSWSLACPSGICGLRHSCGRFYSFVLYSRTIVGYGTFIS